MMEESMVQGPERHAIGQTLARFEGAGVGSNGIVERKRISKNEHRTAARVSSRWLLGGPG
jgi:hypothetical protein